MPMSLPSISAHMPRSRAGSRESKQQFLCYCLVSQPEIRNSRLEIPASVNASYISLARSRLHGYPFSGKENLSIPPSVTESGHSFAGVWLLRSAPGNLFITWADFLMAASSPLSAPSSLVTCESIRIFLGKSRMPVFVVIFYLSFYSKCFSLQYQSTVFFSLTCAASTCQKSTLCCFKTESH